MFCCFKQKTAYEMRISDWSSDVCSSDLIGKPGDRDDVACVSFLHRHALKAPKGKNLGRTARFDHLAVGIERLDRHVHLQRAAGDAAGEDTADEIVAVQQRHQELERAVTVGDRLRHMIDDGRSEEHTSELQSLMRITYA